MSLLAGVRILDLTNVLAGPFAAYQLSLLGADVVKVEMRETGDLARQLGASAELNADLMGASFLAQNAGKRSVTVDLKKPGGTRALLALAGNADVLLENFRPGVMDRLGVGWDVLHAAHPGLVYCAISGFGQTGPMRDRPAYDQIIQGLAGMMEVTGTPESAPLRAGYPVADTIGGLAAALAISAALVARGRTGTGAHVDVSMLESALTAMGWVVSNHLIAGQDPRPLGNENFTAAPSGTFATGDGHLNIAANKQEQFAALCVLLGREDLLADERFAGREARKIHRADLRDELEKSLSARSALDWERELAAVGVPAGRVLSVPDALRQDQIIDRGLVQQVALADRTVQVLGNGIRVDGVPSAPSGPPPRLGQHTDELLREAGLTSAEIAALREEGAV